VPDALLLILSAVVTVLGFSCLALAMEVHWEQVRADRPLPRTTAVGLRVVGVACLFASLVLCLVVDHATMAALVWVLTLTASALVVAFTLTWRPALFAPLVAWTGR
jgi:hypothetical protein